MMRLCSGPHFMPVLALILLHPFTDTDACDAESNGISRGKLAALAKLATSRSATNGDERNSMSRHEPQLISTPTGVAWVSGGQTIGAKPIPEVLTGATTLIVVPSDHAGPAAHGGHNSSAFLFDYVALGGSMVVMLGALLLSPRSTRTSVKSLVRRAPHHSWPHLVRGPTLAGAPYCGRLTQQPAAHICHPMDSPSRACRPGNTCTAPVLPARPGHICRVRRQTLICLVVAAAIVATGPPMPRVPVSAFVLATPGTVAISGPELYHDARRLGCRR